MTTKAIKVDGEWIICSPDNAVLNTGDKDKLEPLDLAYCGTIGDVRIAVPVGKIDVVLDNIEYPDNLETELMSYHLTVYKLDQ